MLGPVVRLVLNKVPGSLRYWIEISISEAGKYLDAQEIQLDEASNCILVQGWNNFGIRQQAVVVLEALLEELNVCM